MFVKGVATIKAKHRVSYADAFAMHLALEEKAALVTGDPEIHRAARKLSKLKLLWKE